MAEDEQPSGWQRVRGFGKAIGGVALIGPAGGIWPLLAIGGGAVGLVGLVTGSTTLKRSGVTIAGGPLSCGAIATEGLWNLGSGKSAGKWGPLSWSTEGVGKDAKGFTSLFSSKKTQAAQAPSGWQRVRGVGKMIGGAALTVPAFGAWPLLAVGGGAVGLIGLLTGSQTLKRTGITIAGGPVSCVATVGEGFANVLTGQPTGKFGPLSWVAQGVDKDRGIDPNSQANSQNAPNAQPNVNYQQEVQKAQTLEQATTLYNQSMKKEHEFKVASDTVNANGDRVIVYQDPRDNNPDKNITYVVGQDGELKEIMPGKTANCILPPVGTKEGGFTALRVEDGKAHGADRDGGNIKVIIKPPTPPTPPAPNLSPPQTPKVARGNSQHIGL